MKRVVLALDLQAGFKPSEYIINTVGKLGAKVPVIATVLTADPANSVGVPWLDEWNLPDEDSCLISTRYVFHRHGYLLPAVVTKMLEKNDVDEVFVTGAHTEAFLLAAGFHLFDAGVKPTLIAPLCLTGQYHQHSVTMRIWEHSIGPVLETIAEANLGVS